MPNRTFVTANQVGEMDALSSTGDEIGDPVPDGTGDTPGKKPFGMIGWFDARGAIVSSAREMTAAFAFMWISLFVSASGTAGPLSVALANGLTYFALSSQLKSCINPFISTARLLTAQLTVSYWAMHITAQCIGAVLAAVFVRFTAHFADLSGAVPAVPDAPWLMMVTGMFGFSFFALVACTASKKDFRPAHALTSGLIFAALQMAINPIGLACFDPYRILFAATFGGWHFLSIWTYFIGPFIGIFLAAMWYWVLRIDHLIEGPNRISRIKEGIKKLK